MIHYKKTKKKYTRLVSSNLLTAHEAATEVVQGRQQRGPAASLTADAAHAPGLRLAGGPPKLSEDPQEGLQQQLPGGLPKPQAE